jgi:hypothetical protein
LFKALGYLIRNVPLGFIRIPDPENDFLPIPDTRIRGPKGTAFFMNTGFVMSRIPALDVPELKKMAEGQHLD